MNRLVAIIASFNLIACASHPAENSAFNVVNYGAKGNGRAKDTVAIQKALDECAANGGGTVELPAGAYLTGSLVLQSNTRLQLASDARLLGSPDLADYPLLNVRWEGEFCAGHRALISASNATNITICGGIIIGPPLSISKLRNPRGPTLIELTDCTNTLLQNFKTRYQQLWSLHFLFCKNLIAQDLTIRSTNANGDGMDFDSCDGVTIDRCDINAGDDAIALKSGRGFAAQNLSRPTQNVVIRDCRLESSLFAALGLGSELSGGIRNVKIQNCVFTGRQNAIFIKSRNGRGGYIEDISGENLTVRESPTFVGINLLNKGLPATDSVPGKTNQWTRVQNISFKGIKVSAVGELVRGTDISDARPLDHFTLDDISGTCEHAISIANMTGVHFSRLQVTGFAGPLILATNVQGVGFGNPTGN